MRHTGMSPTDLSQLETGPFDAYWFPRLFLTIEDSEKNDDRNRNSQQPQQNSTTHDVLLCSVLNYRLVRSGFQLSRI